MRLDNLMDYVQLISLFWSLSSKLMDFMSLMLVELAENGEFPCQ